MSNVIIRPFQPNDRRALRTICCDTADQGGPIENLFPDRECAADLLTGYYTDYEPGSTFVAEKDGKVVAYVQGCFDNRRYGLVMFWIVVPVTLFKAFKRGVFFSRKFWRMGLGMLRNWRRLFSWRKQSFHSHESHMHIGIAQEHRGQQIGKQLVGEFLKHAKHQGINEVTASVHSGNAAASRFFEKLGFKVQEQYPMVMVRGAQAEHYQSLYYVKNIR